VRSCVVEAVEPGEGGHCKVAEDKGGGEVCVHNSSDDGGVYKCEGGVSEAGRELNEVGCVTRERLEDEERRREQERVYIAPQASRSLPGEVAVPENGVSRGMSDRVAGGGRFGKEK
jgi:hypothetical protein